MQSNNFQFQSFKIPSTDYQHQNFPVQTFANQSYPVAVQGQFNVEMQSDEESFENCLAHNQMEVTEQRSQSNKLSLKRRRQSNDLTHHFDQLSLIDFNETLKDDEGSKQFYMMQQATQNQYRSKRKLDYSFSNNFNQENFQADPKIFTSAQSRSSGDSKYSVSQELAIIEQKKKVAKQLLLYKQQRSQATNGFNIEDCCGPEK